MADAYVHPTDMGIGHYFFSHDEPRQLPSGYTEITEILDDFAQQRLWTGSRSSTTTFRLFILGHGSCTLDRAEMTPIFSTTYAIGSTHKPIVMDRTIDMNFAKCWLNGGCDRCRSARTE